MASALQLPFSFEAFISKVGGVGGQDNGTPKYSPTEKKEETVISGTVRIIDIRYNCITFMKEYKDKSPEELRFDDYKAGRITKKLTLGSFLHKFNNSAAPASNRKSPIKKTGAVVAYEVLSKRFETKLFAPKKRCGVGEQGSGTTLVKYSPNVGLELVQKPGNSSNVTVSYVCITMMKEYENKSLEELRLEDYKAGRNLLIKYKKDLDQTGATTTPSVFVFGFKQKYEFAFRDNDDNDLRFHTVHGGHIRLSKDRTTAEQTDLDTYHDCVTFSSRPIHVGEEIYLRLSEISRDGWSLEPGVCFGFTTEDPSSMAHSVPKLAVRTKNSWTTNLGRIFREKDDILHYYVNSFGKLRFGVNGQIQDRILTKIDISRPLWAVIDIFTRKKVQFVGPEALDGVRSTNQVVDGARRPNRSQVEDDPLVDQLRSLSVAESLPAPGRKNPIPLLLHRTKGRNIHFAGRGLAARCDGEYCQGYVFTGRPVRPGQTITVQILTIEESNQGSLAVGLTSCDPATLRPHELPDDAEFLQDRPEYWVVYPDAADGLGIDDKLDVTLTRDGKMEISKNGSNPVAVLHVDHTLELWAFFDIFGATREIRLSISEGLRRPNQVLDGVKRPNQVLDGVRRPNQVLDGVRRSDQGLDGVKHNKGPINVKEKAENLPSTSKNKPETTTKECTICFDNEINSVLSKCGHMCMCYDCAVQLWQNEGSSFGKCPICRAKIRDVIRTYNP